MVLAALCILLGLPAAALFLYYVIFGRLRFVPANHRVVVTSGTNHRVLLPGYNILLPFENPITYNWSFEAEQKRRHNQDDYTKWY